MSAAKSSSGSTPIGPMPVRSVRLPEHLWARLEAARNQVNQGRAEKVSLSSMMRALLEQALASGAPPDFNARILRPDRVYRDRAAKLARTRAHEEARAVFDEVSDVVERLAITPPSFVTAIGGDRSEAVQFYHSGKLPENDPGPFLERVKTWLRAVKSDQQLGDGNSLPMR